MQDERDVGMRFDRGEHHVAQICFARVFARAGGSLQDHGTLRFLGRFHDRLDLLEVVDVECRDAVAVFGGMVKQLAQRDECHECLLI